MKTKRRTKLKKIWNKLQNIKKNNLPKNSSRRTITMQEVRTAEIKNKLKYETRD